MQGIYITKTPRIISKLWPGFLWFLPTSKKELALTFDDGPIPEVTTAVLEILRKYQIKACFFCIGKNVIENPEIFKQIIAEGHQIGNHTQNHLNGWKTKNNRYFSNILETKALFETAFFRPPYGRIRPSQHRFVQKHFNKIVMWSGLSADFNQKISPEKCLENAIGSTQNGTIMVFHDSVKASKNMLFALPKYIEWALENGYSFVPLPSN